MSAEVFYALAGHTVSVAIETVILQRRAVGTVEVFLIQRPADDPFYGAQWHSPGTILRGKDGPDQRNGVPSGFEKAFARLEARELGLKFRSPPRLVGPLFFLSPRGPELCLVHIAEIKDDPKEGKFFSVDELPEAIVVAHRDHIIPAAVQAFMHR